MERIFGRPAAGEVGDPARVGVIAVEVIDPGDALLEGGARLVGQLGDAGVRAGPRPRPAGRRGSAAGSTARAGRRRHRRGSGAAGRGAAGRRGRRGAAPAGSSGRLSAPRARARRARSSACGSSGARASRSRERRQLDPRRARHGVEHRPGEIVQRAVAHAVEPAGGARPILRAQGGEDRAIIVALGRAQLRRRGDGARRRPAPQRGRRRGSWPRRAARPSAPSSTSAPPSASADRPRPASSAPAASAAFRALWLPKS